MIEIYDLKATNKELQNQFNDLYTHTAIKETEKIFKLGKTTFSIRKKIYGIRNKILKTRRAFELLKKKTII
jgi:hypothetical protein